MKLAHEAGLRIPTPPPILTVAGPRDGIQGGEFEFEEGRRSQFRIWVNVGDAVMPERLFWSTSHELKHLDDCVRGLPYDEKIWDDRAIAYAARASERWRRMQWLFAMERRSR